MKRILVILVMFVAITANAQWEDNSNITNQYITSLASCENNIYAGTPWNGIWITTNNGIQWTPYGLYAIWINALTFIGNNIVVGTDSSVYISTNNGMSWIQTVLTNNGVWALAVNNNNIYAGTGSGYPDSCGFYLSTNNGISWLQTELRNKDVKTIAISGNNIFAGTLNYGVYLSTNNGLNWTQTSLNNQTVNSLAVSGNNIFAGTTGNVYLTTNNGISWSQTAPTYPVLSFTVFENNIFAGSGNGVWLTTNNGANWFNKNQGLNGGNVKALLISNNYIFAGTAGYGMKRRLLSEILITDIQNISTESPSKYSLSQNYPNPFNPITNVKFSILNSGDVKLVVYDIMGKEVQTLVNERLQPGTYEAAFDGSMLNSCVYFYKLITNGFTETKKMILIK